MFKLRFYVVAILLSFIFNPTSAAEYSKNWDLDQYQALSEEELLLLSFMSPFSSEKDIIRSYFASEQPNSEHGYFAKEWLSKNKQQKIELIDKCLDVNPTYMPCYANGALNFQGDERLAMQKKAASISPAFNDYNNFHRVYETIKKSNKSAAEQYLNNFYSDNPGHFLKDFIKGEDAYFANNYQEALAFLESAIDKGTTDIDAFIYVAKIKSKYLSDQFDQSKSNLIIATFSDYITRFPEKEDTPEPFWHAATQIENVARRSTSVLELYINAFNKRPTAEILAKIVNPYYISTEGKMVEEVIATAESKHRKNPWMMMEVAEYYLNTMKSDDKGIEYSTLALNNAHTASGYSRLSVRHINQLNLIGRHDQAMKVVMANKVSNSNDKSLLIAGIKTAEFMGQYEFALDLLEKRKALGRLNSSWYLSKRDNLNRYQSGTDKLAKFHRQNPFLAHWEAEFGKSLKIQIEFPSGKAVIPSKYFAELDKVAVLLQNKEAAKYIFNVEGHTDSSGSASLNESLSKQRAKAVAEYFIGKHNIAKENLNIEGFGSRFPVASNKTSADKRLNRRVEILPMGELSAPQVLATGTLNTKNQLSLSPDGHTLAVGNSPIELWDTRIQAKKGELGRGSYAEFSPTGRYLASRSAWTDIYDRVTREVNIFDVKSKLPVRQIALNYKVAKVVWGPFGERVAFIDESGRLFVYGVEKKSALLSFKASPISIDGLLVWSKDGRHIYTGMAQDKTVRVWNADKGNLVRTLTGVNWVHAMGQTYDGKYLLISDNSSVLTSFNTETWEMQQASAGMAAKKITAHPSKHQVVLNSFNNGKVALFDAITLDKLSERSAPKKVSVAFTPDADVIYQADDVIRKLDPMTLEEIGSITGQGTSSFQLSAAEAHDLLISHTEEETIAWDIITGKKIHSWPIKTSRFEGSQDGTGHLYSITEGTLSQVNLDDFTITELTELGIEPEAYEFSENYLLMSAKQEDEDNIQAKGSLRVFDLVSNEEVDSIQVNYVTDALEYDKIYAAGISNLAIDEEHDLFAFNSYWQDGYGHENTYSNTINVHRLSTGKLIKSIIVDEDISDLSFSAGEIVVRSGNLFHYNPITGAFIRRVDIAETTTIKFENAQYQLTNVLASSHIINKETGEVRQLTFNDNLKDIVAFTKQNLIAALLKSGEIKFYDLTDFSEQLTLLAKENGEWISYAPSGHYDASLNGTEQVFWSLGDRLLPFDVLKDKFYQPKLLQDRLTAVRNQDTSQLKAIQETSVVSSDLLSSPYSLKVLSPMKVDTTESSYRLLIETKANNVKVDKLQLAISVNGQTISKSRGLKRKVDNSKETIDIPLELGRNIIQVSVQHQGALLEQQSIIAHRTSSAKITSNQHLWFFGVGVSDYENAQHSLEFAHKDAETLASHFKAQEGQLFKKVHTKVLTNENVTERNVRVEMNRFLKQASSEDTIIIFIAGHGVQDNEQVLYYMPHDGDLADPITGMEVANFQRFLTKRPASQKALFWMDICHAGALGENRRRGGITSEEAIKMLAKGTGVAVMASSTGRESSLESKNFSGGHGAFTAGLLKGLGGAADSEAGNGDGYVSLHELHSFVSRHVPKITKGQQHPTTPTMSNVRDFPITSVLN